MSYRSLGGIPAGAAAAGADEPAQSFPQFDPVPALPGPLVAAMGSVHLVGSDRAGSGAAPHRRNRAGTHT